MQNNGGDFFSKCKNCSTELMHNYYRKQKKNKYWLFHLLIKYNFEKNSFTYVNMLNSEKSHAFRLFLKIYFNLKIKICK